MKPLSIFAHNLLRSHIGREKITGSHLFDESILYGSFCLDPFMDLLATIHNVLNGSSSLPKNSLEFYCHELSAEIETILFVASHVAYQDFSAEKILAALSPSLSPSWVGLSPYRLFHLIRPDMVVDIHKAIEASARAEVDMILTVMENLDLVSSPPILVDPEIFNAKSRIDMVI